MVNPWIVAWLITKATSATEVQTEPWITEPNVITTLPHQQPSCPPPTPEIVQPEILPNLPIQPPTATFGWMPPLDDPKDILIIADQTTAQAATVSSNPLPPTPQGPQEALSPLKQTDPSAQPQPKRSQSSPTTIPQLAPAVTPPTERPQIPTQTTNKSDQITPQNPLKPKPPLSLLETTDTPSNPNPLPSVQHSVTQHNESEGLSINCPGGNLHSDVFGNPTRFGSCSQMNAREREVVILRAPTRMTPQEREYSRQCSRSFPPSTKKHSFHPISAPQMIRCPIGGGSCGHSLINKKNPKGAVFTHFSAHHRDGLFYHIKIEGSHKNYSYTSFPGPSPPTDT